MRASFNRHSTDETIALLRAWVDGDTSYFGTVPCRIDEDDGPIAKILIEAGEIDLLAKARALAPYRKWEREWRLLAEKEARRVYFHQLRTRRNK